MVLFGVYYTSLDFGEAGACGYTLTYVSPFNGKVHFSN